MDIVMEKIASWTSNVSHKLSRGSSRLSRGPTTRSSFDSGRHKRELFRKQKQKRLSAVLEPELLKGVHLKHVLRGFGQTFSTNVGSEQEHRFSIVVTEINDFISHSWSDSRWHKYLSLCLLYNTFAASCGSCALGALLMVLQLDSIAAIPKVSHRGAEPWSGYRPGVINVFVCPVVFCIILFGWQRIKPRMFGQRVLFVDKICVDQVDERKKTEAILGLAGFLNASDRLVVLWTPSYFKRLWCVYEIASWLHLSKPMESIHFVPSSTTSSFMWGFIGCATFYMLYSLSSVLGMNAYISAFCGSILLLPWIHAVRRSTNTLQMLPRIISNFKVEDVTCYCCSHNHLDPSTGQALRCDRELVFNTIRAWFDAGGGNDPEAAITNFEHIVRTSLGEVILKRVGPTQLHYGWTMIVSLPVMWKLFDAAASADSVPDTQTALRFFIGNYIVVFAFVVPSCMKIFLLIIVRVNDRLGSEPYTTTEFLVSFVVFILCFLVSLVLWAPMQFFNSFESPLPLILWDVVCVVLTLVLFRTPCSSGESDDPWTCSDTVQPKPRLGSSFDCLDFPKQGINSDDSSGAFFKALPTLGAWALSSKSEDDYDEDFAFYKEGTCSDPFNGTAATSPCGIDLEEASSKDCDVFKQGALARISGWSWEMEGINGPLDEALPSPGTLRSNAESDDEYDEDFDCFEHGVGSEAIIGTQTCGEKEQPILGAGASYKDCDNPSSLGSNAAKNSLNYAPPSSRVWASNTHANDDYYDEEFDI